MMIFLEPAILFLFLHSVVTANNFHQSGLNIRFKQPGYTGQQRPHIVLIVADDLGYNDVGFHGSDQIPTPNIDFLAYNGVLLNNYNVQPICTPTRATLMTGRYPIHTGLQDSVIVGAQPYGLPLNETLLPQYLNKLGYRSHMVGKWHLGMFQWEYTPLYRGYESHFGYWQGAEDYYTHTYEANKNYWGLDFRRDRDLLWNHTGQYSTFLFRDEAVNIIENHNKSEPLFLYLPFQAVHTGNQDGVPLQAPEDYIKKFDYIQNEDRRVYAGMVSALDDAVGDIYDTLKNTGMLANSIIVFTTDNGGPANGLGHSAANNYPLRGGKYALWEGGLRGVGLLHSPLLKHQGYVSNKLLHVSDWLPTLVSAADGRHLLNFTLLDGIDAWEMLSEDGSAVRNELLHNIDPVIDNSAIRVGDYKLIVGKADVKDRNGWYPPYQLAGDEEALHHLKLDSGDTIRAAGDLTFRENLNINYRTQWPASVIERMRNLYQFAESSSMYTGRYAKQGAGLALRDHSINKSPAGLEGSNGMIHFNRIGTNSGSTEFSRQPVPVDCGSKPSNASTNCQGDKSPCLYHIPSDPCEFNNIAAWNTKIVTELLGRISWYDSTMVPVGKKDLDPAGNPKLHGGAWEPWR